MCMYAGDVHGLAKMHFQQWTSQQTVADPGFSPGGAPTPKVGTRTYFFGQKLHENERILAPGGGGARPWRPPLDPPLTKLPFLKRLFQQKFTFGRASPPVFRSPMACIVFSCN